MQVSPISITQNKLNNGNKAVKSNQPQITQRHNSLADMEFNIIADTIRCQNLKNQMNARLMTLKRNLNNYFAQDLYKK